MNDPLEVLSGGKTKARVLDVLLSHPQQSYHLRGLAKAAGTDSGNTSKLLEPLVESGIVQCARDMHSMRYMINLRSQVVPPLRQLVASAGSLVLDLRVVAARLAATHVSILGSFAAGTDDALSDVDVPAVSELSGVAAQTAIKTAGRKHRKTVNVFTATPADFAKSLVEGAALWRSIAENPRTDLKGSWSDVAKRPTASR